jgi:hypothetical protein
MDNASKEGDTEQCVDASPIAPGWGDTERIPLNVPPSLWAGRSAVEAADALKAAGYDANLIAYVLVKKMGKPKLPVGRLLFPPPPGQEKNDSTYLRKIDAAIRRITSKYRITFLA